MFESLGTIECKTQMSLRVYHSCNFFSTGSRIPWCLSPYMILLPMVSMQVRGFSLI